VGGCYLCATATISAILVCFDYSVKCYAIEPQYAWTCWFNTT